MDIKKLTNINEPFTESEALRVLAIGYTKEEINKINALRGNQGKDNEQTRGIQSTTT